MTFLPSDVLDFETKLAAAETQSRGEAFLEERRRYVQSVIAVSP